LLRDLHSYSIEASIPLSCACSGLLVTCALTSRLYLAEGDKIMVVHLGLVLGLVLGLRLNRFNRVSIYRVKWILRSEGRREILKERQYKIEPLGSELVTAVVAAS
jgi:hypothetical protein